MGERGCHGSPLCLILSCESVVINATAKEASLTLTFTVIIISRRPTQDLSRSTDHRHHSGSGWQHRPWRSTWPLVATWLPSGGSTSLWSSQYNRLQTPTWSLAAAQLTDINTASSGNEGHRHQLGLRWHPRPQMSVWTLGVNMASGGSMNHGGLLWRPGPENKPFFISGILSLLRIRGILWLDINFWDRVSQSSRLLHRSPPALLSKGMFPCPLQPSATPVTSVRSPSASLHSTCSVPPAFPAFNRLFVEVALQTEVCHTVFIPKQLSMQILNAASHWSGSRSLVSEAP